MTSIPFPAKTVRVVDPNTGLSFLIPRYDGPLGSRVRIALVSTVGEAYAALQAIRGERGTDE